VGERGRASLGQPVRDRLLREAHRRGLNYNLTIEVGSTLVLGRRLAILKDVSVETLPVDLVGRIYKSVDLADADTVATALHVWCRDDLNLGRCPGCPKE
jgi:hypothetical protein